LVILGRVAILLNPEVRHSTIWLYQTYGFEAAQAERENRTIYDIHLYNTQASLSNRLLKKSR
jgi:hypothetical protein